MADLSDFKRGQFVGACMAGVNITKNPELFGVARSTVSKIMTAFGKEGKKHLTEAKLRLLRRSLRRITKIQLLKLQQSCNIHISRYMQKHIQHNKDEWTQFFRKIYFSLYLKGFERVTKGIICERWVGDWTELRHIYPPPQLFWLQQHFFPVLQSCSTGGLGAQPQLGHGSHSSIFFPTDLNFLSPGLYNNLTPAYFLRASHLFSIQPIDSQGIPWSPDIFDRMHLLFTQVHFSSDSPAGSEVNMLQSLMTILRIFTLFCPTTYILNIYDS